MKTKIFDMDEKVLNQLVRHNKLSNPSENYLTKLDLIDHYPELFDSRKKEFNLSVEEIEQLRSMQVNSSIKKVEFQKKSSSIITNTEQRKLDELFKDNKNYHQQKTQNKVLRGIANKMGLNLS